MTNTLCHEDFAPHVDASFGFDGWHGRLRLVRIEVSRHPAAPGMRAPFTLIFQGVRGELLAEGFWTATADDGSRFEIYVMPIHTPAPDRQEYQAVFN